ncbi:hypothetical protein M514_23423 [Trichuris suis]|uniref:Reverse transcriptase domain-containing protein n=1 Tax=Trichuris suis TaxID=68888 RepID=A0A085N4K3_9BILA|nr:hypothetical protein M514_23423 [Trichuris suis]
MKAYLESQKYLVSTTRQGRFRYKRLPLDFSFALALFQRILEQILACVESAAVYIDDTAAAACDEQQHMKNCTWRWSRIRKQECERGSRNVNSCAGLRNNPDTRLMRMASIPLKHEYRPLNTLRAIAQVNEKGSAVDVGKRGQTQWLV